MTEYDNQIAHLTKLATTPGWWQYARMRARELETLWPGISQEVRDRVQALGFRPAREEQGEWWAQ